MYCEALTLRNKELKASSGKAFLLKAPQEERKDIHLIIKQEAHVVGTLLLHPISAKCVQIKQVAIDSRYQGAGLGKNLLIYAEQVARNFGFCFVFLTGRQQAWRFYEKLHYRSISDDYQEGQLIMRIYKKDIRSPLEKIKEREMRTNG
ncbi:MULTISPECIES: GNAT family N-acetyltransferase [Enterococcus]|uniref:GNAT family N-acetyltransferase n=1 Tax=Candidatus Enterococcus murrayae TaxID=2815321 RepID=A0ABS3HED2_9ENTE|nr:GNAT family N-acetyltransferase [Enterococcus sp. MJM16]MBO0451304.1 GNAT family N-acetyltransferase [Enterococcus sp. MJM16]